MQDGDLIREYADHESEAAFAQLVERHLNFVYSTCRRMLDDAQAAEDATQIVFLSLAKHAPSLRGKASVGGWLYTAARFACGNLRRRESRRERYEGEAAREMMNGGSIDGGWNEIAPLLEDAMQSLRPVEREAVILRFFQGYTLQETGESLGVSEDAARKRMERALDKLRVYFVRHGVTVSVTAMAIVISDRAVEAAPITVSSVLHSVKVASVVGAACSSIISGSEGVLKMMWIARLKVVGVVGAVLMGGAAAVGGAHGLHKKALPVVAQAVLAKAAKALPVVAQAAPAKAAKLLPVASQAAPAKTAKAAPGMAAPKAKAAAKPPVAASLAKAAVGATKVSAAPGNPFLPKGFTMPDVDGTVVTPDGKPFAGALVTWCTLDEHDNTPLTTTTDGQGRFHFDGKTAWPKNEAYGGMLVQADGYALGGGNIDVHSDTSRQLPLKITLGLPTQVQIKLLTPEGQPAAGVSLSLRGLHKDSTHLTLAGNIPAAQHKSGADGMVSLTGVPQGGTLLIRVDDPRYAELLLKERQITLAKAENTESRMITLAPAASIEGTISYPDGKPAPGIWVDARSEDDRPNDGCAESGANGRFVLQQMRPGRYIVSADLWPSLYLDWAAHEAIASVATGEHETGLKLTLIKGVVITGHVTYSGSGKPVAGIGVSAGMVNGNEIGNSIATISSEDGSYKLRTAGGNLNVSVEPGGGVQSSKYLVAKDGDLETVDLVVDPPKPPIVVTGIVTDQAGNPVADADVSGATTAYNQTTSQTHSGPDGKFTLSLPNSSIVFLDARQGTRATAHQIPTISGDTVTLKLVDNALAKIMGKVVDADGKPVAGAEVNVFRNEFHSDSLQGTATTDAAGGYQIAGAPPGFRYSVQVKAVGYGQVEVEVPSLGVGETLTAGDITLGRIDSYVAGHVVDSHGFPLAGAEVIARNTEVGAATTDKQGKFRINNMAQGYVDIQIKAGDEFASYRVTAGKDDIVIRTQSWATQQKLVDAALQKQAAQPRPAASAAKYAPEFNVSTWVNVSPISMSDLKGKIIIFDMWGGGSDNLADTQLVAQQFGARGVVAIGLRADNAPLKDVQDRIAGGRLTMPIGIDTNEVMEKSLGASGTEVFVLVDRDGKIVYTGSDFSQMLTTLSKLLGT